MAEITLRVLDGADRGRVYDGLQTPITVGREEGNAVQLNDERISRFHIKIQEDQEKLVLVLVMMPDELAFELHKLNVLAIELTDDVGAPGLRELPKFVGEVHLPVLAIAHVCLAQRQADRR